MENGNLDSIDGVIRKEEWQFDYHGDSLQIPDDEGRINILRFMVERKENDDNQIEIVHYTTRHIVGQNDFTDKLESPSVSLVENILNITPPEEKSISFSSFKRDFVVSQFKEEAKQDNNYSIHINGEQVIYIKVPKNVQITSDAFIEYIGEDS